MSALVQPHVSIKSKGQIHVTSRVGQGRVGIKRKLLQKLSYASSTWKTKTTKIIARKKTNNRNCRRPILLQPKIGTQSKIILKPPEIQKKFIYAGFSFCSINCSKLIFFLEQNCIELKTSFHPLLWTSSGLRDSWKTAPYVGKDRFTEHAQNQLGCKTV